MKVIRHTRPRIEQLEARDCPALTLRYLPTALILTGRPTGALEIKGQASGLFNISDNGKSLGNYDLNRNLILQLSSQPSDLEIDLNGKTIGGNVIANLGNGYTGAPSTSVSVDLFDSTNSGASVRGSVTLVKGNGRELIGIGGMTDAGGTFQTGAVTIRGNLTVAAKVSGQFQDRLQAGSGTKIGGSVSLIQVDAVSLGEQNVGGITVGGNTSVTTTGASSGTTVTVLGNFGGNVAVSGLATTSQFNAFTLETQLPGGPGSTVGGNLSVTFGQARLGNVYQILADAGNPFTSEVGGNVTLTSRNSLAAAPLSDFYLMQGVISGSLFVNLGFGDSDFSFMNSGGGINASVEGDIRIQGASGGVTNIGTVFGNVFEGDVGGSVSILLGNGTNNTSIQSAVSGRVTYRGGNGTDTFELAPAAAQIYLVDLLFGTGTNTLMLTSQVTLNGVVRGSGGFNTFSQGGATLLPTLVFINFP